MGNIDKKWLKWIAFAILVGFIIGKIITTIVTYLFATIKFQLLINLITPICMIIGLLAFLYYYSKNRFKD